MSYEALVQENPDHIRVEVTGERESSQQIIESAKEFWPRILDLCDEKGVYRVLAIFNLRGDLPTLTAYELGEWAANYGRNTRAKIAFVDLNEESRNINRFVEDVAVNRALNPEMVKVFGDERSAKEWLLKE
jgi:hypothetical protein